MVDTPGTAGEQPERQIQIQKIYLKDTSFEAPNAAEVFKLEWKPNVNVNLQSQQKPLGEDVYEVGLHITVEAKLDDKVAFLCEVQQAGMFFVRGFNQQETHKVLGSFCPSQLFPYAREAIVDLVGKGGFPHLLLQPMNFDALYEQSLQELAKAQAEASESGDRH